MNSIPFILCLGRSRGGASIHSQDEYGQPLCSCFIYSPILPPKQIHWLTYCVNVEPEPRGIFGVPLITSIPYANVAISLFNEQGESYIYGYVPIVVAKCGVFLKEKGRLLSNVKSVTFADSTYTMQQLMLRVFSALRDLKSGSRS